MTKKINLQTLAALAAAADKDDPREIAAELDKRAQRRAPRVPVLYDYYNGHGVRFATLADARRAVREALRVDPLSVRPLDYWSATDSKIKRAYIRRVSPSGSVRYFGIF